MHLDVFQKDSATSRAGQDISTTLVGCPAVCFFQSVTNVEAILLVTSTTFRLDRHVPQYWTSCSLRIVVNNKHIIC